MGLQCPPSLLGLPPRQMQAELQAEQLTQLPVFTDFFQ
jgi:hypothetical protein